VVRLILASGSPRRKELLARLNVPFEVRPVDITEEPGRSVNPQIVARRLAREKAEAARLIDEHAPILAADTVVASQGRLLAKPQNDADARKMLTSLGGRTHEVVTGVAFMPLGKRAPLVRHPLTHVTMREYSDTEIDASVARGTPFDKAGGYAIQDDKFAPVASYEGCYCNVIGLSLWATIEVMLKSGERLDLGKVEFLPQCGNCPLRPPELRLPRLNLG
jgi:MAF protein